MFGINTFSLLTVLLIVYLVNTVSNLPKKHRNRIIKLAALILFAYNFLNLMRNPSNLPVEYSSITYLVSPLLILMNIKKLEVWAIYSSLMAGFFYFLVMILYGGPTYHLYSNMYIYTSLYCHGSLLFMGLVLLRTRNIKEHQSYKLIIGNLLVGVWAMYRKPHVNPATRLFIYELIEGTHVYSINSIPLLITLPLYYLVIGYLVYRSSKWIYSLNRSMRRKALIKKTRLKIQYN